MEDIKKCLICGGEKFSKFIETQDFFLTQKNFNIVKCEKCGFKFTNPRPTPLGLVKYYKSDKYVSHSDTKKGIINLLYQIIKKQAIKKKYKIILKYAKGDKILDIGCGTGSLLKYFTCKGWDTFGIEPNEKAREYAWNKRLKNIFDEDKIDDFNLNSFDVITMWHVLEHVSELNKRIEDVYKLLKKDGLLLIAVPNSDSKDAEIYKEYWAAYDVPRHLYHFNIKSMKMLLGKNKFKIEKILPMRYDAYYISMLSEKYKTGKLNILTSFNNGLRSNIFARNNGNYSSLMFLIRKK